MFVSFEGIDGCGKSTQIAALTEALRARGEVVLLTREPGGTSLAEALRAALLHGCDPVDARAELLLFGAARAQHVAQVIAPALERGEWVLCDRFADSSEAYQGAALGLDRAFVRAMNEFATVGCWPRRTFLLDLDPEVARDRTRARAPSQGSPAGDDRIESRGLEFARRVRAAFLEIARENPERFVVLDATRAPDELTAVLLAELDVLAPRVSASEAS